MQLISENDDRCCNSIKVVCHLFDTFLERDWRDKQKVVDSLKDTVDKQKRDLDSMRKEIREKEMLCSALRVSCMFFIDLTLSLY